MHTTYEDETLKLTADTTEEKRFLTQLFVHGIIGTDALWENDTDIFVGEIKIKPKPFPKNWTKQ